jgi:glycosyltransferase involved in cell wall biosynthesis
MLHANAPWECSGYGRQAAMWAPLWQSLGHDIAVSAFHGLAGSATTWNDIPVYPAGDDMWGMDVLAGHARHFGADLVITLMDLWPVNPAGFGGLKVAHWVPVDCQPLGAGDRWVLGESQGVPVAMSRHGEAMMRAAGLDPLYAPHGVDCDVFRPPADRDGLRRELGVADRFVIGVCAANQDKSRKGFPEQFQAFARFRGKHPEAVMLVYTRADNTLTGGLDLRALARACGVEEHVWFCDQYAYQAGFTPGEAMSRWYGCLDVLSACAWAEGFGLPLVEAQAAGVPVVATRAASMTELCGAGWLAGGERFWNYQHEAWWLKPSVTAIARSYEKAFACAGRKAGQAREFAVQYDAKRVLKEHWEPVLAALSTTTPR